MSGTWKHLKMLDFPKKWDKTSHLLGNTQRQVNFVSFLWEIQYFQICFHAMCTFMYLFVVYFSFAPIIWASIHHYVNYFDIQVPMMVTETETLTSTLHNNKFTYLDYVFLLPSYCRILIPIYFHIYICPVSWGCRIHWLHLCRGVRPLP